MTPMSADDVIRISDPDEMIKVYNRILASRQGGKKVRRGGCSIRMLDREGTSYELTTVYTYKPGRFSKEQSIVVTLTLERESDGLYSGTISSSTFRILADKRGSLEEVWSGEMAEARKKMPEVVKAYIEDIGELKNEVSR